MLRKLPNHEFTGDGLCGRTRRRTDRMKTTRRSIPNNLFSVEDDNRFIRISTHLQEIVVEIGNNLTSELECEWYEFDQFYKALRGLLTERTAHIPSSTDKTPTAANGSAGNGTPE